MSIFLVDTLSPCTRMMAVPRTLTTTEKFICTRRIFFAPLDAIGVNVLALL